MTYEHRTKIRKLGTHPLMSVMAGCAKRHDHLPGRTELLAAIRGALGEDADDKLVTRAYKDALAIATEYNRDPRSFNRGAVYTAVESVLDFAEETDRLIPTPAPQKDTTDYADVAGQVAWLAAGHTADTWPQEQADRAERARLARLGVTRAG